MKSIRLLSGAMALAMSVTLGGAATASAHVVSDTGTHGDVVLTDTEASPPATCAYAFAGSSGGVDTYLFHSMKVKAPKVFAANKNPDRRDSRLVSWRYYLIEFRPASPGGYDVVRSPVQKARAYDDAAAPFSSMRVAYNGAAENYYVVRVAIKWFKPDGSVEGRMTFVFDWYRHKDTGVKQENGCDGAFYMS